MASRTEQESSTPSVSVEEQEVRESTVADADRLKEEVSVTSGVKEELGIFWKFFEKIKNIRNEFKNWNISKAFAVLFWSSSASQSEVLSDTNTGNPSDNADWTNGQVSWWSDRESAWWQQTVSESKEHENTEMVPIKELIPNIKYDIKYATTDNFIKKKVYNSQEENLKLQYQALKKLKKAEEIANKQWLSLKIWDAYRPDSAQVELWNWYDAAWLDRSLKTGRVARPKSLGWRWSNHLWGQAVDLTLVDENGNELEMPTDFDEFNGKEKWNSVDKLPDSSEKKKNAMKLKEIMTEAWFTVYSGERWHFESKSW